MREIVLDTETTGLEPRDGHRIIEIGCVELIDKIKTGNTYHVYINPGRDVPQEAFKIHGISDEFLKDKPKFKKIAKDFIKFIEGTNIIAHNASFDMKFINYELRKVQLEIIERRFVIDSLKIARNKFPGSPNSLDALCKRFGVDSSRREKHGALLDAELLADVYLELMGGSQISMFSDKKDAETIDSQQKLHEKNNKHKNVLESRNFELTEEELKLHKEFITKNFKKNLWGYN